MQSGCGGLTAPVCFTARGLTKAGLAAPLLDHLPCPVDCALECTGSEVCLTEALEATADGGRVVLVGRSPHPSYLPLGRAAEREVDVLGSFRYCGGGWPRYGARPVGEVARVALRRDHCKATGLFGNSSYAGRATNRNVTGWFEGSDL